MVYRIIFVKGGTHHLRAYGGGDTVLLNLKKAIELNGITSTMYVLFDTSATNVYADPSLNFIGIPSLQNANYFLKYTSSFPERLLSGFIVDSDIIITNDPLSLFHVLQYKKNVGSSNQFKVVWMPSGNELTCPLHTEVCPYSNSISKTYGHMVNYNFFLRKCLPHILTNKGLSPYHIIIWHIFRKNVLDYLDALLAKRSVYLEGCMYIGMANRCRYVSFGIDIDKFKPRSKEESYSFISSLLERHIVYGNYESFTSAIKDGKIILGYVGATNPRWKNVEDLLKMWKGLSEKYSNIILMLVLRDYKAILHLINSFSAKKTFILKPLPYEYIHYIYNLFDIFVNPSLLDSLEYNTLEALASGNIVVVSDAGSIRDLHKFGIHPLMFRRGNVDELLLILSDVVEKIDMYSRYFDRVRDNFREIFNLREWGKRVIKALKELNLL
ncbi:glycosyltransferase family 4 protein [Pyrobaculum sp.]|uniref:glycosyltransferase family 4 protein n=1 Tax=Pyrobaculum sp. TaxID=2004705 RepID=UPI00316E30E2